MNDGRTVASDECKTSRACPVPVEVSRSRDHSCDVTTTTTTTNNKQQTTPISTSTNQRSTMTMGSLRDAPVAVAVGATLVTVAGTVFLLRKKRRKVELRRPRSWSFTSTGMALGSFPPRVDCPEHVISASIMFQDCPKPDDVLKLIIPKMLQYERLATIPEPENGSSRHPVSELDPSRLVRHVVVNGDRQCTLDAIRDHLFDSVVVGREDLPWWELLIIENTGPGVSACVLRFHHCLADGISMLKVVEDLITNVDGSPVDTILPPGIHKKFKEKVPFLKLLWTSIVAAIQVLTLSMTAFDDDTAFSCGNKDMIHTRNRSFVMLRPMPLDFIKALKNAANVTVNDVLFACLSQTIHDYLVEQECPVLKARGNKLQCRAFMIVGIPPLDEMKDKSLTLRNKWVLASASMDVGESDVVNRLEHVHTRLAALKNSPLVPVQMRIQDYLIPLLPVAVSRQTVFDTFSRHSLVFTNIPGPGKSVLFAGKEVTEMQMFYGNLVSQVSFMSYRGMIFGNFCLDNEAIPNSQSLSRLYTNSFVQLAKRLNVTVPMSVLEE